MNLPKIVDLPTPTPRLAQSLQPSDLAKHRMQIAAQVKATLRGYWQSAVDETIDAVELTDWIAALEDWSFPEVQAALRQWVYDNPSRRPNFGHIRAALIAKRGTQFAASRKLEPESEREAPCSKEAAAEILASVGFNVRRFSE